MSNLGDTVSAATLALQRLTESVQQRGSAPHRGAVRLLVGSGGCCLAVGAAGVVRALRRGAAERGVPVGVVEAGCTGMCWADVQVTLQRPGQPDLTWNRVGPGDAPALLDIAAGLRPPASQAGGFAWSGEGAHGLPALSSVPFLAGQQRVITERFGRTDPTGLGEALERGGYAGLAGALALTPEQVIAQVKDAGVAGRGGAYFPAGIKWESCRRAGEAPRSLVVNAEEGEPGVFKDRHLLEGDPHLLIEGLLIAAYAIGAEQAFVVVNGGARLAQQRLEAALEQARAAGLLGPAALGSGFGCAVEVRRGAGGYVLGEESALLESIEGRRSMPRVRPPFPHQAGLWGRPTVINNAETLANVAVLFRRGAPAWRGRGDAPWPGTKLISVSGDVAHPGLVEVPIGVPLRTVIAGLAGGVPAGRTLQAVLTGGPSGVFAPPELLDEPLEPRRSDVLLGSGNLVALDSTHALLDALRLLARFNAEESCGKCTPCREGVNRMSEILERRAAGRERTGDRDDLLLLADLAASASICGLGQMAANPVRSALRHFALPGLTAATEGLTP